MAWITALDGWPPMEDIAGLILRLVGAFYAVGALFGLCRCAMDLLMTRALAALGAPDPAEAQRISLHVAQILLVGLGGIALMALLNLALPIFLASLALQALYAWVIGPRLGDPGDPPGSAALMQRQRSRLLFLAVTLLAAAAAHAGLLRDPRAEPWPALLLAALLALGLLGHAAHLLRGTARALPAPAPLPVTEVAPLEEGPAPEFDEGLRRAAFILSPSWNEGGLFEAETRRPVSQDLPPDMLTEADRAAIRHWLEVFRELADPADPQRCRFIAPEGAARMAAEGAGVFEQLAARLAPCPLRFVPVPWPRLSRHGAMAVRFMAEQSVSPLWLSDESGHVPVDPHEFGLSWNLAVEMNVWALDFDAGTGWEDPSRAPRWTETEAAAHEAEGLRLAHRLARELAATGRGHLPVSFWSEREARAIPIQGA
jgi:hypothetical protein